jgi:hypothetical protein
VCNDSTNTCACNSGWAGDDCSIRDKELVNGVAQQGAADTRAWAYYHISAVSSRGDLRIEVNQTGTGGDCDTYVRLNAYPQRQVYDYRDISTNKNVVIEVPHPNGMYYIGVYGFLGCDFTIRATVKTDCPNDCSGHGTCGNGGVCTCQASYVGTDCSQHVSALTAGTPSAGHVDKAKWDYYTFQNTLNTLTVTLQQTGAAGTEDCDLYVRYNQMPSLSEYDYRDTGLDTTVTLKATNANVGLYYIGVYGFKDCTYTITAESKAECPNRCSGTNHGSCNRDSTSCHCTQQYSGTACETMVSTLSFDKSTPGYVSDNYWNYYHFQTFTSSNVLISLDQDTNVMDCDLYIKKSQNPTRTSYDYRDISFHQNISITIEDPAQATYYIGVFGYKECAYSLKIHATTLCPNSCTSSSQGTCVNSHCECKTGWSGQDCSVPDNKLDNGVTEKSNIAVDQWEYWAFEAKAGATVSILMKELNSTGFLWLFANQQSFPTLAAYDYSDVETNMNVHSIHFVPTNDGAISIGVYGGPIAIPNSLYAYDLSAWQANFRSVLTRVHNPEEYKL